jgi:hypothetical protein
MNQLFLKLYCSASDQVNYICYIVQCSDLGHVQFWSSLKNSHCERGGGQNTRGPECSEGPGNLGKMFVLFIIALCVSYMKYAYLHTDRRVIDRKTYRPNVKYTIFRSFSQQKQLADCDEK